MFWIVGVASTGSTSKLPQVGKEDGRDAEIKSHAKKIVSFKLKRIFKNRQSTSSKSRLRFQSIEDATRATREAFGRDDLAEPRGLGERDALPARLDPRFK